MSRRQKPSKQINDRFTHAVGQYLCDSDLAFGPGVAMSRRLMHGGPGTSGDQMDHPMGSLHPPINHLGCAYRVTSTPLSPKGGDGYSALAQDIVPTLIGLNLYLVASGNQPRWMPS